MTLPLFATLGMLSLLSSACGSAVESPTASSPLSSSSTSSGASIPPVAPSGNSNVPVAVLKAMFTATEAPPSAAFPHYSYSLTLEVTETSGKSAAIVQALIVKTPDGNTDIGCVPLNVRIGAGEIVDVIKRAGYCAPGAFGRFPGSVLSAAITYSDEAGASATLNTFALLE